MQNLTHRTFSALIAISIFTIIMYFFAESGVYAMVLFTVMRGSYEMSRMFFKKTYPRFVPWFLMFICVSTFVLCTTDQFRALAPIVILFAFVAIIFSAIFLHKKFEQIESVLNYITLSNLSLIYTAVIPLSAAWMLYQPHGLKWFLCLLAVVFTGDIGAYIAGTLFGKTKIAPLLSPNKSLQGALGGLLFSTLAACSFSLVLDHVPLQILAVCGFFGGLFGQVGDFFESLIKRVAGVKDSGSIMPGHGGVLDRLDGVLLAAPLFYIAAYYLGL